MQWKTHITTTLALTLPLVAASNEVSWINIGALAVGSLLPDIDHPRSVIGKRHKVVSNVTRTAFGHRGITHSFIGIFVVYGLMLFFQKNYLAPPTKWLPFWLIVGYLAHIIEDSFSSRGVHWTWPFFNKKRKQRLFIYYRTGSLSEYLLLGFFMCLIIVELYLFYQAAWSHIIPVDVQGKIGMWIMRIQTMLYF